MIVCTFNDGLSCRQFSSGDDNFDWRSELSGILERMRKKRSIVFATHYCRGSNILYVETGSLPDGRWCYKAESLIPNCPVSVFRSPRIDFDQDLPF